MTEPRRPVRKTREQIQKSKKVKQWSSLWWKWIIIWMLVFFILIIWLLFFFFFYLVKNPNVGKWLWLSAWSIKSITSVFAWIFFWTFFLLFLILWISYLYKLLAKPTWKVWNLIWTIFVFILWLSNMWFAYYVFGQIYNIKEDNWPNTTEVLVANAITSDDNGWIKYMPLYENNFPLIAPIWISFQLNNKIFKNMYIPSIIKKEWWNIKPISFILNCWNWQKLTFKSYNFPASKYCLYLLKWSYDVKLEFKYLNKDRKIKTLDLPKKTINIDSNITIKSKYKLNDEKNEIIWWEAGDKISLDLSSVPMDLGLQSNNILIDFYWKWNFKEYKWIVNFHYQNDGLYYLSFKIPDKNLPDYTFPIRILASTKPTCDIQYKNNENSYTIETYWKSPNWPIVKYDTMVIDSQTNSVIASKNKNILTTTLKDWRTYQVKVRIKDSKWNIGSCSKIIDLSSKVTYHFKLSVKSKYSSIQTGTNITIKVKKIPTKYQIKINNITPSSYSNVWFDIDNDWQIDEKSNTISVNITNKKDKIINAIVEDQYWNKTIKQIKFKIDLQPVVAQLMTDKYKWSSPLKIKFDASSSYVTSSWDDIAFFNWDFGDWQTINNTRQWVISHTYQKPWVYTAKVEVETDNWYKAIATKKIIVFKPINSATIVFPDNLWWQIEAWDTLQIQLNTNWAIKSINWDFGDGQTFTCNGRECTQISHTYAKKWLYKISAKIIYLDGSPSTTVFASINVIWE